MPTLLLIYCPCPDAATAQSLGEAMVEARLAACINHFGVAQSYYLWQGVPEKASEQVLMIKTLPSVRAEAIAWLETHHPYEVPAILAWEVESNEAFHQFVSHSVTPPLIKRLATP